MAGVPMKVFGCFLVALCLLVPLISAKAADVKYCDKKANYIVKVNGLDIDPYPISRGSNTTFAISATTGQPITGGKLVIDVSYFWFHVHSEDRDLCKDTSCPIDVGDFLVSHSQELPGITPPGSYTLTMKMVDGNNNQLTCITVDFSIGFIAEETLAVM
ncbi:putative phosphatidylglycerol/phosphatidylinositol transfer protein DDB_G0282179 [Salvia splendens]|uniref:putative phosphatidylglycerol/phosphatidylinositol transfer protein DDB_G0282179 n=1 Tax=Salvia splendens TaxID=180675 RepID=UPI001104D46F|nr:putative phosphatidylglycerol/phosphatidylinositol transfer protein DDB_G0282179 [Salvia splendens]